MTFGGSFICPVSCKGNAVLGRLGKRGSFGSSVLSTPNRPPRRIGVSQWAPSPLCFLPGVLVAVMCCRVLPQKNPCCLVILSPFKKSALYTFVLFWGQGFSLGQDKIWSGFHTGHGWFFLLPSSSSVCFWVPLVSQIFAVVCLGWLKSALRFCGRRFAPSFFCGLAPPLCGCFLGLRGSVGRRLAFFCFLSL